MWRTTGITYTNGFQLNWLNLTVKKRIVNGWNSFKAFLNGLNGVLKFLTDCFHFLYVFFAKISTGFITARLESASRCH